MFSLTTTWNSRAAATASGLSHDRLQLWLKREHPIATGVSGGSRGVPRAFYFRGIMELALGRALVDQGMSPKDAFHAAAKVAYTTSRQGGKVLREAGFPFPPTQGGTLALVFNGRTEVVPSGEAMLHGAFGPKAEAMTVINVNRVFNDVCNRLDLDAQEVLAQVYARTPRQLA